MNPMVLMTATLSALCFALGTIFVRIGLKSGDSISALWFVLLVNVVLLWGLSLYLYGFHIDIWQWRYFILAGFFAPLSGRLFRYLSMQKIGVNVSSPIIQNHPFLAIAIAVAFLGERLTAGELLSSLLAITGSVLVGAGGLSKSGLAFPRRYLYLPLAGMACYAVSTIFRRVGIEIGTPALTAAAVTVTTSWILLSLIALLRTDMEVRLGSLHGLIFFGMSGLATGAAVPLFYYALHSGTVVIVMPIMATQTVFTLILSYMFLRRGYDELFSPMVIAGTFSVVAGVALLGVLSGPQ